MSKLKNVIAITDLADFKTKVLKSTLPVLVDFSAAWCGPCKVIAPHVAALADQYAGKLVAVTVDIDTCTPVAEQYDVQAVPTLLLFKDGQVVGQLVGALPRAKLDAFVQKVL